METSNFTANCVKFAQLANHNGEPREIHVIITNFYHSLLLKCTPTFTANLAKSAQFANTWCESREINQLRTNFNKSSIFLTLVRQDPTPCLRELRESRNFTLTSRNLHFRIYPMLYCDTNFCKYCYKRIIPAPHTVHKIATVLDGKKTHSYITKTLTFPNSNPLLRHKQFESQESNFIFVILAYSGSRTCLWFHISSRIKEVVTSPRK